MGVYENSIPRRQSTGRREHIESRRAERGRATRVSGRDRRAPARRSAPSPKGASFLSTLRDRLPEPPSTKAGRAGLVAAIVVVVLLLFLYGPIRNYYIAWRVGQIYSAELAEINADNEELQDEVTRLQSREGIEDEARKRGYVSEGETAVTVEGLDESDTSGSDGAQDGSSDAGDAWYIPVLDLVFGFDKSTIDVS